LSQKHWLRNCVGRMDFRVQPLRRLQDSAKPGSNAGVLVLRERERQLQSSFRGAPLGASAESIPQMLGRLRSASVHIPDSSRTSREVRKVPREDIRPGASLHFSTDGNANRAPGAPCRQRGGFPQRSAAGRPSRRSHRPGVPCSTSFACDVQPTGPGIQESPESGLTLTP
jgi:hypothetical protein